MSYEDNDEIDETLGDEDEGSLFAGDEEESLAEAQPAVKEANAGCKVRRNIEEILERKRYRDQLGEDLAFE